MKLYKIKKSNIDRNGRCLYAAKNIKAGTKIIEYVGNIITKKQTEDSDKFDNSKPIYLFNLNKRYDLDGDVSWNSARLINHSCSNNAEYDGTGFVGWQKQENGVSVQNLIENALLKAIGQRVNLYVAGRTDAGVHAIKQVAHFDYKATKKLEIKNLSEAINFYIGFK